MTELNAGELLSGFPPIVGVHPRVLILGSMPSVKSLERGQYYGHPRNHFWTIVCNLLNEPVPQDYVQRVGLLKEAGIAVWDVFDQCRREGSLDQSIRDAKPNDVVGFIRNFPSLKLVAFNGRKAEQGFYGSNAYNAVQDMECCDFVRLPSSSPIPTKKHKRWQDKIDEWRIVLTYLQD